MKKAEALEAAEGPILLLYKPNLHRVLALGRTMEDPLNDTTKSNITIAIVGGGIGGMCVAIGLGQAGYNVHVFEQTDEFSEIGAGVTFAPNSLNAIKHLGILDAYEKIACIFEPGKYLIKYMRWDDGDEIGETICAGRSSTVHRAQLLQCLVKLLPSNVTTHLSARVISVTNSASQESESVRLTFQPPFLPSTFDADVVIGCDGIRSTVRGCVLRELYGSQEVGEKMGGNIRYTGTYAYRGVLPTAEALKYLGESFSTTVMWMGVDKHVLAFPIEDGSSINLVAFVADRSDADPDSDYYRWEGSWVKPCTQEEMLRNFVGWDQRCVGLLELIKNPQQWALHDLIPMKKSTVGRMTLLGDAAHASLPHNGAGAGQATEDAWVLSALLSHPSCTMDKLPRFLEAYERVRSPRSGSQITYSRETGDIYDLASIYCDNPESLKQVLATRFDWIWDHDLTEDIKQAFHWLVETGVIDEH